MVVTVTDHAHPMPVTARVVAGVTSSAGTMSFVMDRAAPIVPVGAAISINIGRSASPVRRYDNTLILWDKAEAGARVSVILDALHSFGLADRTLAVAFSVAPSPADVRDFGAAPAELGVWIEVRLTDGAASPGIAEADGSWTLAPGRVLAAGRSRS
jgi:hypothetical protein